MSWLSNIISSPKSILQLGGLSALTNIVTSIGGGILNNGIIKSAIPIVGADIIKILEGVAEKQFPTVAPAIRAVVAAATVFNPNLTMWLQGFLNDQIKPSTPLVIDGIYGPATTAAVKEFQREHGLDPDGWFGTITREFVEDKLGVTPPPVPQIDPQTAA
jgi:peptidoglycan hydrolase-like protein with peptidoglycan-binding domain